MTEINFETIKKARKAFIFLARWWRNEFLPAMRIASNVISFRFLEWLNHYRKIYFRRKYRRLGYRRINRRLVKKWERRYRE